ncbi:MAG: hypothetical protein ACP5KA_02505 [Desulfurococcaceae archaeon]|jgi:hypothetical protein
MGGRQKTTIFMVKETVRKGEEKSKEKTKEKAKQQKEKGESGKGK